MNKPLDRNGYLKRATTLHPVVLNDGATVNIRPLPASVIINGAKDSALFEPANLLVQSIVDEKGQRLFTDGETDQALTIDYDSLRKIMDAITELNGLKPDKNGEPGAVEKN